MISCWRRVPQISQAWVIKVSLRSSTHLPVVLGYHWMRESIHQSRILMKARTSAKQDLVSMLHKHTSPHHRTLINRAWSVTTAKEVNKIAVVDGIAAPELTIEVFQVRTWSKETTTEPHREDPRTREQTIDQWIVVSRISTRVQEVALVRDMATSIGKQVTVALMFHKISNREIYSIRKTRMRIHQNSLGTNPSLERKETEVWLEQASTTMRKP